MKKLLTSISALLCTIAGFSQHYTGKQAESIYKNAAQIRYDERSQAPVFIEWKSNAYVSKTAAIDVLKKVLHMQPGDNLKGTRSDQDESGMNHLRYQQYYQNIKVVSGEYILHEQQGRIITANGLFHANLKINTTPSVSESASLQSALKEVNAKSYKWEIREEEAHKKLLDKNSSASWYPKGELVILPSMKGVKTQTPTLCWKFDVYAHEPMSRYDMYVDAQNGNVLYKENRICNVSVTGSGNTKYSGTQTFITDSVSAGNYRLRDASRGNGVETYNMQNGTVYGSAVDFTDADNVWTSTVNQDNAALDAHWGAQKTYDYYLTVHGRNSYNNAGGVFRSYIHYSSSYNNAFWDGSVMTYGDGDGASFSPLTELDVCGHELSHGVTQYASGLIYSYESGALNESFSDIFGKSIDFWVNPSTANWKLAGKCYTPSTPGDALRYMNNPNSGGDPDTYLGTNWYTGSGDNGGVHTNSGVQNFWYYLLANGGSGTNDNGFAYNVAGIGLIKAAKIAYRCNEVYLISSSQYADAAFYSLKSASDLYGNCSPEAVAVKNAWDAVGVMGLKLNPNATASVSGGNCIGSNLQLSASGGTNYSWTGPNNFSSTQQNPVINNASSAAAGNYNCVITDGCSDNVGVIVTLAPAPSVTSTPNAMICKGSSVNLVATASVNGAGGNNGTNNTPLNLPDYPAAGVFSSIVVSGATNASSIVSVTIDSLTHTWDGDLDIKLIAPNGTTITLCSGVGSSGDNFLHTVFNSGSATLITSGAAPFNGSYRPQQAFSGFNGSANGIWKLKITDLGGQDVGTLWKWSIALAPNTINSYSWSPAAGLTNPAIPNPVASPSSTGAYAVTVTDALGCTASESTLITVSNPAIAKTFSNVTCNGGNNGSINITTTGGIGNYNYSWSNNSINEDPSGLTAGMYIVSVMDSLNCIVKDTTILTEPPLLTLTVTKTDANCGSNDGTATANPSGGTGSYTYLWNNGATTSSLNNLAPGVYTVTVKDSNNCASSNSNTVDSKGSNPAAPGPINGTAGACRNQNNAQYSVPVVPGALSYNWIKPTGTTAVINNNQITLTFGSTYVTGNLCVSVTTACGTSPQTCLSIPYLATKPGTPGTINGSAVACANTTVTYSVNPVLRATVYNWTAPANAVVTSGQGTNTVQISFNNSFTSGTMSVNAGNCIGVSGNRSKKVQGKASMPGAITGVTNNLCGATGVTYSIAPSTTGATSYNWTVPASGSITNGQGSTAITASYGSSPLNGSVCVTADNICGSSAARCFAVSLLAARPASITGPSSVCVNQAGVNFNVITQPGVTYNWTVPSGASVANGQGTGAVTVNWGTVVGNISVVAHNSCGNQTSRTKAITINCRMADSDMNAEVQVYPNPAHDMATLTLNGIPLPCNVVMMDAIGKQVFTNIFNDEQTEIDLSALAKGLYFLQVKTENINKTVRLVVE